ncbi:MAG: sigma factor-like helix-turn-helix DNA-binding protein [Deltaproteobacteria bacterium]|nr:sigma factor-like helix-turn-helix DNA-binding protein [Deltaproteobacteria bacterium]
MSAALSFAPLLAPRLAVEDLTEDTLDALLSPSERHVVRLRYGIGAHPCSPALIARRLHLRITTVHRLHARALRKLWIDAG